MSAVPRSAQLVGRSRELAVAARLVDGAARGRGATLLVTGEAGIGKTRLLAEIAACARAAGLGVLAGRAVSGGGTYRAVAEALAPLLRDPTALDAVQLRPFRAARQDRRRPPRRAARLGSRPLPRESPIS